MQLHFTKTSPYARMVRIAIRAKGLTGRVEEIAAPTRTPGSPYYAVNPSGRVPYLVRDDGLGIEDSQLILLYLDAIAPKPRLTRSPDTADWRWGRLEAYARSFTDGVSVWVREMRRPETERSPTILAHEVARALRLADFWEGNVEDALLAAELDVVQLLLLTGIDFAIAYGMAPLRDDRPRLAAWHERINRNPWVQETSPL